MNTATAAAIPCARCGSPEDSNLHLTARQCGPGCRAPQDHHVYRPDPEILAAQLAAERERSRELLKALRGIFDYVGALYALGNVEGPAVKAHLRTARAAIAKAEGR